MNDKLYTLKDVLKVYPDIAYSVIEWWVSNGFAICQKSSGTGIPHLYTLPQIQWIGLLRHFGRIGITSKGVQFNGIIKARNVEADGLCFNEFREKLLTLKWSRLGCIVRSRVVHFTPQTTRTLKGKKVEFKVVVQDSDLPLPTGANFFYYISLFNIHINCLDGVTL